MNKEVNLFYHVILIIEPLEAAITNLLQVVLPDYLAVKSKSLECNILKIGIYGNHLHFIISIPPHLSTIEIINIIKKDSINYLKKNIKDVNFDWTEDFYISTISPDDIGSVSTLFHANAKFNGDATLSEESSDFMKTE